jgi:hypothetical protein
VAALAQLIASNQIDPSEHALLMLTAKGDRDPFAPSASS